MRWVFMFGPGILLVLHSVAIGQAAPPVSSPAESVPILRVARSADGLTFHDTDQMVTPHASAPSLLRLPNGHLVVVFDMHVPGPNAQSVLTLSRSRDEGRSWSAPEPIRLTGLESGVCLRRGQLIAMPDGSMRLYCIAMEAGAGEEATSPAVEPAILCAVTRDGTSFRLDEAIHLPLKGLPDPEITVAGVGDRIHMFVAAGISGHEDRTQHLVSEDGRRFRSTKPPRLPELGLIRSFVPADAHVRAYLLDIDGVRSMVSRDLLGWTPEPGVRLGGRSDPAVVQMADGSFLMVYAQLPLPERRRLLAAAGEMAADVDNQIVESRIASARNLRQLGPALLTYAEQNEGWLPPTLDALMDEGMIDAQRLVSPLEPGGGYSYVYIDGQSYNMDPYNIVAYENPANHGHAGTVVLFLDSHVEWMDTNTLERRLRETLERLSHDGP